MMNFLLIISDTVGLYIVGALVVVAALATCCFILYFIAKRKSEVPKTVEILPETEGDKITKKLNEEQAKILLESKLQIEEKQGKFYIKEKGKEGFVSVAASKEEAIQIVHQLAKEHKEVVEVNSKKGIDGEMVSYTNDKQSFK